MAGNIKPTRSLTNFLFVTLLKTRSCVYIYVFGNKNAFTMKDLEYKVPHLRLTLEDCSTCLKDRSDPNLTSACANSFDDEDAEILEDLRVAKDSLERLQYVFPECDNVLVESQDPNNDICDIGLLETSVFDQRDATDVIVPGMGGVHGELIQKWLQENFEENDDSTIPRGQVYTAYLSCCDLYGIKPINAATFGKVVRTVFPHVRTRRIGVRGHSKYHYCGIGLRPRKDRCVEDKQSIDEDMTHLLQTLQFPSVDTIETKSESLQEILILLSNFPTADALDVKDRDKTKEFQRMYKTHAASILDCVLKANFYQIHDVMLNFWRSLGLHQLGLLVQPEMVDYIGRCDKFIYYVINDVLIPNPIKPLTIGIMQATKDFVRNLQYWIQEGFSLMPKALSKVKLEAAKEFKTSVLRQIQISHETVAARVALDDPSEAERLSRDWQALPLEDLYMKCRLLLNDVDGRKETHLRKYTAEFEFLLSSGRPLDWYMDWIKGIVNHHKQQVAAQDKESSANASRNLILEWSFVSSEVLYQLSLNHSLASGTFHLLDMLLKDYAIYLINRD